MLPMPIPEQLKEAVAVQPSNCNGIAHSSSSINALITDKEMTYIRDVRDRFCAVNPEYLTERNLFLRCGD